MSVARLESPFLREEPISHQFARHYSALRALRHRRELTRSALYLKIEPELGRVLGAVERGVARAPAVRSRSGLRVVAWNIQRGQRFDAIRRAFVDDPVLCRADVICLSEVDVGMGRSSNRNVARELAASLGMSYVFGVSYLVLEDDYGENPDGAANTLALAGAAVLSRAPIGRVENVDLPELRDKFSSSEKRLGKKRALLAEIELTDGPLTIAACHLDSNASSAQRRLQLETLLDRAEAFSRAPILVGGDFNTTTYDLQTRFRLARNILHKLFITGFSATIGHYMTPERIYERPLFAALEARNYQVDTFNDRSRGTMNFDLNDAYAIAKTQRNVGRLLTWLLRQLLRPWNGVVPARLDWFAARGLGARDACVVEPRDADGRSASDHAAIVVDLA